MALSFGTSHLGSIGSYGSSSATSAHNLTTTAGAAVGTLVTLNVSASNARLVGSVTDTRSNTWTVHTGSQNGTTVSSQWVTAPITTAIQTGDTITVNFTGGSANAGIHANAWANLDITGSRVHTLTNGTVASTADPALSAQAVGSTAGGVDVMRLMGWGSGGAQTSGISANGFDTEIGEVYSTGTVRGSWGAGIPLTNGATSHAPSANGTTARVWAYSILEILEAAAPPAGNDGAFFAVL